MEAISGELLNFDIDPADFVFGTGRGLLSQRAEMFTRMHGKAGRFVYAPMTHIPGVRAEEASEILPPKLQIRRYSKAIPPRVVSSNDDSNIGDSASVIKRGPGGELEGDEEEEEVETPERIINYNDVEEAIEEVPPVGETEAAPPTEDTETVEPDPTEPLSVLELDWNVLSNSLEHQTQLYELAQPQSMTHHPPTLVVRRAQPFTIYVVFSRAFRFHFDDVTLVFQMGPEPSVSQGTSVRVPLDAGFKRHSWSAGLCESLGGAHLESEGRGVRYAVKVMTPTNCLIGKYNLAIESKLLEGVRGKGKKEEGGKGDGPRGSGGEGRAPRGSGGEGGVPRESGGEEEQEVVVLTYKDKEAKMYVLFNPFCRDDQVYLEDEVLRDEVVVNDTGHLFYGNQHQSGIRPWKYGQYSRMVVDCCLYLLDASMLRLSSRGSAVDVVRAICSLVNSPDDSGLLVSSWSGQYKDGTAPTQWMSSLAVLEQFWDTRRPVKYGQSWVFAGCATTLCRCLGIPTRCVTGFCTAHDCDGANTINTHWDVEGIPIDELNRDVTWSFHVWAESYMTRPDLPGRYNGWQAFDPTPQVTRDGIQCAGPCPVRAIKSGDTYLRDGVSLMYSELNAFRFHWSMQRDGTYRNTVQRHVAGRRIVTSYPRLEAMTQYVHDHSKTESGIDLLHDYKEIEDTEQDRASLQRANTWATHPGVYDCGTGDVYFSFDQKYGVPAGTTFDVTLCAQNKCRYERTVRIALTLASVHCTGAVKRKLRSQIFDINLCSLQTKRAVVRLMGEDYSLVMSDHASFNIYAQARVLETGQLYCNSDDYMLTLPKLEIETPPVLHEGTRFKCTIKFTSPMPVTLVNCEFMVEAFGALHATKIRHADIEPHDLAEVSVEMVPHIHGKMLIFASLHSRELTSIYGERVVHVGITHQGH